MCSSRVSQTSGVFKLTLTPRICFGIILGANFLTLTLTLLNIFELEMQLEKFSRYINDMEIFARNLICNHKVQIV